MLTLAHREIDPFENMIGAERLVDVAQPHHRVGLRERSAGSSYVEFGRPRPGRVAVAAEQVDQCVLGEAQPVVNSEAKGALSLCVVVVELLSDPKKEAAQPVMETIAGFRDTGALVRLQRVTGRVTH